MWGVFKDMMSISDGVWNNNKIRRLSKKSVIDDVAFGEGEMGLQGQRYDGDDGDDMNSFVCFVDELSPA